MDKIKKEFKTVKDLRENMNAFKILYGRVSETKISGAYLSNGELCHLDNHLILSICARSFSVKERDGKPLNTKNLIKIQSRFENTITETYFTMV